MSFIKKTGVFIAQLFAALVAIVCIIGAFFSLFDLLSPEYIVGTVITLIIVILVGSAAISEWLANKKTKAD